MKKFSMYFVATPIGNMVDISYRAVETLKQSDFILAEDTRHSGKLCKELEINPKFISYHKFNYKSVIPKVLELLKEGSIISLITDAGTPGISDPGNEIIAHLEKENISYSVIPGATAFVNAYLLSGFSGMLTFIGFLPNKQGEKKTLIKEILNYKSNLIFYVSPHKINETIDLLYLYMGDRKICIVREITKIHEEIYHSTLKKGYKNVPRGEFVLIVEGLKRHDLNPLNNGKMEEHLDYYTNIGYTKNDAIKQVALDRGVGRQVIYKKAVLLGKDK